MLGEYFDDMIKAVVDVRQNILAANADLHADLAAFLLEKGSKQEDLWGINIFPFEEGDSFIIYDSMINIRPRQNNRSRTVQDEALRQKIKEIVTSRIS